MHVVSRRVNWLINEAMCFKVNGRRISLHNENDIAVSMQKYSYTSLYSYSYIATEPIATV